MIWGAIKLIIFLALACVIGLFLSAVEVGGKPLSARVSELWGRPEMKRAVGEVSSRVKRGVEAASGSETEPSNAPPHRSAAPRAAQAAASNPAKAIAPDGDAPSGIVAEPRPADAYKPAEREAVAKLIAQKSHRSAKSP